MQPPSQSRFITSSTWFHSTTFSLHGVGSAFHSQPIEMPLYGKGTQQELLSASQRLNENINMPWVILSSGVDEKLFPRAVSVAMTAGASGFLAGRAVWSSVVGLPDTELMLRDVSAPKLQRLGDIVDEMMARRR